MFDYITKELEDSEDRTFFITIFKNIKISEEQSIALGNIKTEKPKGPFQKEDIINMIDKNKLKVETKAFLVITYNIFIIIY